jgi:hypothetical protein
MRKGISAMKRPGLGALLLTMALALGAGCSDDPAAHPAAAQTCPAAAPDDGAIAEYWGYQQITTTLRVRLMRSDTDFELTWYIANPSESELPPNALDGLTDLLGSYESDGLTQTRENGIPNALSAVLWNVLLSSFASDLGAVCTGQSRVANELAPDVAADFEALCGWPAKQSRAPELLERVWRHVMAFDAPPEELAAFQELFESSELLSWQPPQVISAIVRSMVLNPHFLLRK